MDPTPPQTCLRCCQIFQDQYISTNSNMGILQPPPRLFYLRYTSCYWSRYIPYGLRDEASMLLPKSTLCVNIFIINILKCLVIVINNDLEDWNGGFGPIYFLMDILHMFIQKMIQMILLRSLLTWLLQEGLINTNKK